MGFDSAANCSMHGADISSDEDDLTQVGRMSRISSSALDSCEDIDDFRQKLLLSGGEDAVSCFDIGNAPSFPAPLTLHSCCRRRPRGTIKSWRTSSQATRGAAWLWRAKVSTSTPSCFFHSPVPDTVAVIVTGRRIVDVCDDFGSTPLHIAASMGDMVAVRALLRAGANIVAPDVGCSG